MSTREPFWAKYIRDETKRARRAEEDAHIFEQTLAVEVATWFARGGIND
jgi:hypothetical protein